MANPMAVLQQYLELCSCDINRLTLHLASNAILEWNGVTMRGNTKIVKFLLQKHQLSGLVQNFPTAQSVEPFEERETHESTKTIPRENWIKDVNLKKRHPSESQDLASPGTSSEELGASASFQTPPRTLPALPHPPPLTAGRHFLPLSSDEEDEAEQLSDITTPAEPRVNVYSELRYLEAVGAIRMNLEPKHRGTRTTHHVSRDDSSADGSSITPTNSEANEKPTKLKLSYRMHTHTRQPQFALIIYELQSTRSTTVRRNLFSESDNPIGSDEEPSTTHRRFAVSPELVPLPDSPPGEPFPTDRPPNPQPPGTPIKRRRNPPVIAGMRTSPRRRPRPVDDLIGSPGIGDIPSEQDSLQATWPRKKSSESNDSEPLIKRSRKLLSIPTTVKKPLRF
ncbi:uncharacterized protein LOC129755289 [Uranotaenia lowii]|uniref:uncharacterized protein LOC129755289 n=1 Tax=Uranotaenia lowii TaxID=190385 RepID=UPI00247AD13B|nr:uncharacterized protein LOC129755289 [Uranotaenia lowii]